MIIENDFNLMEALALIKEADIIAVDTETDGLNVRKNNVIGIGVYFDSHGFYAYKKDHMKALAEALNGKKLLAWNSYFDMEMIRNSIGIDLWSSLYADVLCLKHTIEEEQPFKLKDVAKKKFGHDATKEQEELKASIKKNGGSPTDFYKADLEILGKYCIQDCKLTLDLYDLYAGDLVDQELEDFFFKDEVMPLYKEVTRFMMANGIKINLGKCVKLQNDIQLDIDKLEKKIQDRIKPDLSIFEKWFLNKDYKPSRTGTFAQGAIALSNLNVPKTASGKFSTARTTLEPFKKNRYIKYIQGDLYLTEKEIYDIQLKLWKLEDSGYMFNLSSKFHLKKLFFDTYNEKPVSKTALGSPQVNDEFLEKMAEKYEWVKWLQDYNKLIKLKGAYIDRILEKSEDGVFYPNFFQHRTVSGRYGSDLQQLPRVAEEGQFSTLVTGYRNQIREIFIARNNHKFIDADYESLEPHIFAHVSNEDKIRSIFDKGHDFYSTIAIITENPPNVVADKVADNYLGKVNKKLRQRAKVYSLGIPYGMEAYALSKNLNIGQARAQELINNYKDGFPNLKKWMEETDELIENKGFVSSQAGRKRRFKRQQSILKGFGKQILNSLDLHSKYSSNEKKYKEMKELRKLVKNALNNAKNFQIQSFAASITNRACININRKMAEKNISGGVVAQVHDQIIVETPDAYTEMVKKIVQEEMESVFKDILTVNLKAPAEIGENFADAH